MLQAYSMLSLQCLQTVQLGVDFQAILLSNWGENANNDIEILVHHMSLFVECRAGIYSRSCPDWLGVVPRDFFEPGHKNSSRKINNTSFHDFCTWHLIMLIW